MDFTYTLLGRASGRLPDKIVRRLLALVLLAVGTRVALF